MAQLRVELLFQILGSSETVETYLPSVQPVKHLVYAVSTGLLLFIFLYFFLRPIPRTYFYVSPQMAWLGFILFSTLFYTQEHHFNVSGFNSFFPNSYTREGDKTI